MPKEIQLGKRKRMSFASTDEIVQMPNLIDIQIQSYEWFMKEGLLEAFKSISPIKDHSEDLLLEFVDCELGTKPKYDVQECKIRDANYAVPLKVLLRFINKANGEIKEQSVFMGDFPLMTEKGTFIINGAERVVVSQLVRSPGSYYDFTYDKSGTKLFSTTVIPSRGAWLEYETDSNEILYARIDRTRKLPLTVLLRALGFESDEDIIEEFGEDDRLLRTLEKDSTSSQKEALLEIYKKLRPGEPLAVKNAASLIASFFFEDRRYDLAKVGRYKFGKKLELKHRITGRVAAEDVVSPFGELLVRKGELITDEIAEDINDSGVKAVYVIGDKEQPVKVISNNFVRLDRYIDTTDMKIADRVYFPVLKSIFDEYEDFDDIKANEEEIKIRILKENYTRAIHRWKDALYEKESKITLETDALHGQCKVDGYKIEYTPKNNFVGTDYIQYKYDEDTKRSEKERVRAERIIKVFGDVKEIKENQEIKLFANETVVDEEVVAIKFTKKPKHGELYLNGEMVEEYPSQVDVDGSVVSYVPDKYFIGADKAQCTVIYRDGSKSEEVFEVNINGNIEYTAINNAVELPFHGSFADITKQAENGEAVSTAKGIKYTPNQDFVGVDTFDVEYKNEKGKIVTESIVVEVEGSAIETEVNLTKEIEGNHFKMAKLKEKPAHGKLKIEEDRLIYTPKTHFVGNDIFTITIGKEEIKYVVIVKDTSMITNIGEPLVIREQEPSERLKITSKPKNGSARVKNNELVYTPKDNFTGKDVVKFTREVDGIAKENIVVTITVKDNSVDTVVNESVEYDIKNVDPSRIKLVGKPKNGNSKLIGNVIIYTPKANYIGKDKVKYSVVNQEGKKINKFFTANVVGSIMPLATNDVLKLDVQDSKVVFTKKPRFGSVVVEDGNVVYTPNEDFEGNDVLEFFIERNGKKIDKKFIVRVGGTALTTYINEEIFFMNTELEKIKFEQKPEKGKVEVRDGMVYYVPNEDFSGRDVFSYKEDNEEKTLKTYVVEVIDDHQYLSSNEKVIFDDEKVDKITKEPQHGIATLKDSYIVYVPDKNFIGNDMVEFEYRDLEGKKRHKTVKLFVKAPLKTGNVGDTIKLMVNNASLNVDIIENPQHGKAEIVSTEENGKNQFFIIYKPNKGFVGEDHVIYTVGRPDGKKISKAFSIIVNKDEKYTLENKPVNIFVGSDVKVKFDNEVENADVSFEDGKIRIKPEQGFVGEIPVKYTVAKASDKSKIKRETVVVVASEVVKAGVNKTYKISIKNAKKDDIQIKRAPLFADVEIEDEAILVTPHQNYVGTDILSYTVGSKKTAPETVVGFKFECEVIYVDLNKSLVFGGRDRIVNSESYPLVPKYITEDDIVASVSYLLGLPHGIGHIDDIDHLGNRRIRSVGELLQNQLRIGLTRLERTAKEKMTTTGADVITPQSLINIRPVNAAIKEFFGSSQLSQFMDQTNPIAELTNKRRLSALGPGGLSRERAGFDVRDVHYSHYGRMCPIETPEGPNIGLIGYLSIFGRVNEYGFIETPYRVVDKANRRVTDEVVYITADKEDNSVVVPSTEPLDEDGRFVNDKIIGRRLSEVAEFLAEEVDYMEVAAQQMVSVATSMIPFLENDDATRALMGSNMQRQAVPLVRSQAPVVGTGMEYHTGMYSGAIVSAKHSGTVTYVSADVIKVEREDGIEDEYRLLNFVRSNQGTCVGNRPIVALGDKVLKGDVLADGQSTELGEIALGANLLIAFMTWEGYNYEDAILLSEELVKWDVLSSIHIEKHEIRARQTKLGPEEITCEIPNVSADALKDLDEKGIIRIGAEVSSGDILVGKVTPKGETDPTPEDKLLKAIFGEKSREVKDMSLRVPHGEKGIVIDVKEFDRENGDELEPGVNQQIRVYIAKKRKIRVGDKMAGRHGNKGVISRILPREDMPFLDDGTPVEVVLNPLGVPSRMNIGQVLEVHLGLAAKKLGWHMATPVFDGANEFDIMNLLEKAGYPNDGKLPVRDGRTGEYFDNRPTVGYMYMLKLHHLVDDKLHARSVGPYSLVTQQPLGGKAQFGGQRFGEMEVWALEAYGAAHTLQEILTIKSDDVIGRVKAYEQITKGESVPEPGMPESFKVLIKELKALALDIELVKSEEDVVGMEVKSEETKELQEPTLPPEITEEFDESEDILELHDDLDDLDDYEEIGFEEE